MTEVRHPKPIEYQPNESLAESWGGQARKLWGEKLGSLAELVHESSVLLETGIGMGIPGFKDPAERFIVHKDGSVLPDLGKLMEFVGVDNLPQVAFLVASTLTGEDVNAVVGLAREMKENGVQAVVPILTSLAHERQDHKFTDKGTGQKMEQITTLKDVIEALSHYCDGALLLHPHSHRGVELGTRLGFPILPIDGLNLLLEKSGYQATENLIELGPDAGRQDAARVAANFFNCPLLSLEKERDRLKMGKPRMIWPEGAREWIRNCGCTVVITDDEIRDAGTTEAITADLEGFASDVRIIAVKAIMSDEIKPRTMIRDGQLVTVRAETDWVASSAVQKLNKPWIREVLITDAVQPQADLAPIAEKIRIISLKPELEALTGYLKENWRPLNELWLRDPEQMGTRLNLDLTVEKVNHK